MNFSVMQENKPIFAPEILKLWDNNYDIYSSNGFAIWNNTKCKLFSSHDEDED